MGKIADFFFGPLEARSDDSAPTQPVSSTPVIPSRAASSRSVSSGDALGLGSVFRAVQVISTAMQQMPLEVYRAGEKLDPAPAWIRQPDMDSTRPAFLEQTAVSMALSGNAYWLIDRDSQSRVTNLSVLNPLDMVIDSTPSGRITGYQSAGTRYTPDRIQQLRYLRVPGSAYGLGPIQAAQLDLRGAIDTRGYASNWFADSGVPGGILSSTQPLSPDQAGQYKTAWLEGMTDDSRLAVLGAGLDYKPLVLSPEDAQWLSAQNFSITQVARMFGIPASLLLASLEGSTQTYQNIAQAWTELARFTLANYQIEIEQAFSSLLPRGTEARLNVEGLLRADTSTRYTSYATALASGWMTPNEVRALEDLSPIAGGDVLPKPTPAIAATPTKETARG